MLAEIVKLKKSNLQKSLLRKSRHKFGNIARDKILVQTLQGRY